MDKSFASWHEFVSNQCWTSCLFARWLSELRKLEGCCKFASKNGANADLWLPRRGRWCIRIALSAFRRRPHYYSRFSSSVIFPICSSVHALPLSLALGGRPAFTAKRVRQERWGGRKDSEMNRWAELVSFGQDVIPSLSPTSVIDTSKMRPFSRRKRSAHLLFKWQFTADRGSMKWNFILKKKKGEHFYCDFKPKKQQALCDPGTESDTFPVAGCASREPSQQQVVVLIFSFPMRKSCI